MGNEKLRKDLHRTIRTRDLNAVKHIILKKYTFSNKNALSTPLYLAVSNSDIDIVKFLLDNGADINKCKSPPLHKAINLGNVEMVKLLVDHGADIEQVYLGNSPLYLALCKRNTNITKYLLERGADPNTLFINYCDAIYNKIPIDIFKILIKYKVSLNIQNSHFKTPIYYAIKCTNYPLIKLLLENNASLTIPEGYNNHYLITAVKHNCDISILRLLIKYGVPVNEQDDLERTSLHYCVSAGKHDILKLLLDYDADPNITDSCLGTPLHYAVSRNDIISTTLLIEKGANVNIHNDTIDTVLNIAVGNRNKVLINLLLMYGANTRLKSRNPLIHKALETKDINILSEILNHGAEVNIYNREGYTPLYIAIITFMQIKFAKLLLRYGSNPNMKNESNENTPLHGAILSNRLDSVELLMSYNVDVHSINKLGHTPLSCINYISDKIATIIISKIVLDLEKDSNLFLLDGFKANIECIDQNDRFKVIRKNCEDELKSIRNIKLNHRYSLSIFLHSDNNNNILIRFLNHPKVEKLSSCISIYKKYIQKTKLSSSIRYKLIHDAIEYSNNISMINSVPINVKYMIMEMLDNKDLKSIIDSVNK